MGSGVISPLIQVITIVALLITLLITAHKPPSRWVLTSPLALDPKPPEEEFRGEQSRFAVVVQGLGFRA